MIAFFRRNRGSSLLLIAASLIIFLVFMPLSVVINAAIPKTASVTAKAVSGSIWRGVVADLKIGPLAMGRVETALKIFPLFLARTDFHIDRSAGEGQPSLTGTMSSGLGSSALRNVTGQIPLTMVDERLPLSRVELQDFSARFESGRCRQASGSVRLMMKPGGLSSLGLDSGFLGQARCDGNALLLPLVSQSAMERADIRISPGGSYTITINIQNQNPQSALLLTAYGFQPISGGHRLIVKRQF